MFEFRPIDAQNRAEVTAFIERHWFSTEMILRGEVIDMTTPEGIVADHDGAIAGLVTYRIQDGECEILSLDSLIERQGLGAELVQRVITIAKDANCRKIKLITTNDNLNALRFYQKRGFDMVRLYHNSLAQARALKPGIPLTGAFGIPLRHEIELEMQLAP